MGGPHLAVGMRITGTHHRAPVFEDLHVIDSVKAAKFAELAHPSVNNDLDCFGRHGRERQIVTRRKADNPANAWFTLSHQQAFVFYVEAIRRRLCFQGCKVILENESRLVLRVANSSRPRISWA